MASAELRLGLNLSVDMDDPQEVADMLKEMIEQTERFTPHTLVIDSEHALYVEFGTGPASGKKDPSKDVMQEFDDWVRDKLHIVDPKKRRKVAKNIYHYVMENGIPPQPFLRPAVVRVRQKLPPNFFAEGGSIRELLENWLKPEIQRILEEENITYSGDIRDSIRVVEGEYEVEMPDIPANVWNDPELGYDGQKKAVHRGQGR